MSSVDAACARNLIYEIPTIRPGYIRENFPSGAHPVGMLPWNLSVKMMGVPTYRSIMRTDLILIFDAILFDRALYNPLFNFMSTLYLFLPWAKKRGKKMGFYNVGAGPVSTPQGRRMLRELSDNMDFIAVRDQDSFDILQEIGVKNPRTIIAADAALNAPSSDDSRVHAILTKHGLDPGRPILAININTYIDTWAQTGRSSMGKERFLTTYAAALNRAAENLDAQWMFLTTQHADVAITRELISRLRPSIRPCLLTNVEYNHYDVKGILRNISLLFGMRLHSMIMASSELTPIIGLAYQPKVHHYFSTLGMPERCLGFEDFSEENVCRHLLAGWEKRSAIRSHLVQFIPPLQRKARQPAELVAALDRGEDLDAAIARIKRP